MTYAAETISSNHYSVDQQVQDALDFLDLQYPHYLEEILRDFPEIQNIEWDGSWFDTEAMGVDIEWSSWLIDAIEATGVIIWEEGEPYHDPRDLT